MAGMTDNMADLKGLPVLKNSQAP